MSDAEQTRAGRLVDATTEPVDAATVVLLRDARADRRADPATDLPADGPDHPDVAGFEVLLLERHLDSDFAGGALVFPGGKVDDTDRDLDAARWTGRSLRDWLGRLGVDRTADALSLLVAAVRETFEEAGVLLARREDGAPVTAEDLAEPSFVDARRRLAARDETWDWRRWLEDEELVLDLGSLALWSWWVTPEGQHKRFDTRFFAALLPTGQDARHDDVETTSLHWLTPQAALAAGDAGKVTIIFPTRRNLRALAAYRSAAAVWEAADAGRVDQRRIEPRVVRVGGQVMVQHPDEDAPEPI